MLVDKYRPTSLKKVIGQPHIVKTLQKALEEENLPHTLLFVGPKGTGKTSVARIVAAKVGCTSPLEIDGASNRGIDSIRELKEEIRYCPAEGSRVIMLDECHMLTKEAFNALLKTLEEPPDDTFFILLTTDASKIPATVLSRCSRHQFHTIDTKSMLAYINAVVKKEQIVVEPAALDTIISLADGSLRDALTAIEQSNMYSEKITDDDIRQLFGIPEQEQIKTAFQIIKDKDIKGAINLSYNLKNIGTNGVQFCYELKRTLEKSQLTPIRTAMLKKILERMLQYEYASNDQIFIALTMLDLIEIMEHAR